jgi:hypothetical protein
MKTTILIALFFMVVDCVSQLNAGTYTEEQGSFKVGNKAESPKTPEIYHLKKAELKYILKPKHQLPVSNVDVFILTFPSLITTPFPENNMVYAEYYVPRNLKTFPATVVLDITGGDQSLSRTISSYLASRGIGCLFVQMAYYGPKKVAQNGDTLYYSLPDNALDFGTFYKSTTDSLGELVNKLPKTNNSFLIIFCDKNQENKMYVHILYFISFSPYSINFNSEYFIQLLFFYLL